MLMTLRFSQMKSNRPKLLLSVERECTKVGLCINAKKTKALPINTRDPPSLPTTDCIELCWLGRRLSI